MVLVDDRVGSRDLVPQLKALGCNPALAHLDFADVACFGYGPADANYDIGIERKTISDLLHSIESGRLTGHQIPGLRQDYDVGYLVVEGLWRAGPEGVLEVFRGVPGQRPTWQPPYGRPWMYADVVSLLNSITVQGEIHVVRTGTRNETCLAIHGLMTWWGKRWREHRTLKVIHGTRPALAPMHTPSLLRVMAAQIPAIGWEWSGVVERTFGSVAEMVEAPVEVWSELRPWGRTRAGNRRAKLGRKRAMQVVQALKGGQ